MHRAIVVREGKIVARTFAMHAERRLQGALPTYGALRPGQADSRAHTQTKTNDCIARLNFILTTVT